MKRIYLAARYSRREELCRYRVELERYGFVVTSRWLNGNMYVDSDGTYFRGLESECSRLTKEDWEDMLSADIVICFTQEMRALSGDATGVEFGAALATDKRVIVVGPRESSFHWLPGLEIFPEWGDVLRVLLRGVEAALRSVDAK